MGAEAQLRRLGGRKPNKSPPVFSHDFIIQNHADIMSCVAMVFVVGLMFKASAPVASVFITLQYNITGGDETKPTEPWVYLYGAKDAATVFFYSLCCIIIHAAVQEYIIDKVKNRMHLSKTKTAKFSESGQLLLFYIAACVASGYIIYKENFLGSISSLWVDYPARHREMTFQMKMFFLVNIAYWFHQYPEFYFMKVKRDDIKYRSIYSTLYLAFVIGAFVLNFSRVSVCMFALHYFAEAIYHVARLVHFWEKPNLSKPLWRLWNIAFVVVRLACVMLAVLTFWYGLRISQQSVVDFASGNFNTGFIRLNCLLIICGVQAWLMWNFTTAILRRNRERMPAQTNPKNKQRYELRSQAKKMARKQRAEYNALTEADQDVRQRGGKEE